MEKQNISQGETPDSGGVAVESPQPPGQGLVSCELSALRALDRDIAERVMGIECEVLPPRPVGWKLLDRSKSFHDESNRQPTMWSKPFLMEKGRNVFVAMYSTDIAAAMEVIDRARERDIRVTMSNSKYPMGSASPFMVNNWHVIATAQPDYCVITTGECLPEAICRAILDVLPNNVPERDADTKPD